MTEQQFIDSQDEIGSIAEDEAKKIREILRKSSIVTAGLVSLSYSKQNVNTPSGLAELNQLIDEVSAERTAAFDEVDTILNEYVEDINTKEGEILNDFIEDTSVSPINLAAFAILGLSYDEWLKSYRDNDINRISNSIRVSATQQLGTTDTIKDLRKSMNTSLRSSDYVTGNIGYAAANQTIVDSSEANNMKLRFSAVVDNRTSDICLEYNDQVFEPADAPRPPLHPNCRSILVPTKR